MKSNSIFSKQRRLSCSEKVLIKSWNEMCYCSKIFNTKVKKQGQLISLMNLWIFIAHVQFHFELNKIITVNKSLFCSLRVSVVHHHITWYDLSFYDYAFPVCLHYYICAKSIELVYLNWHIYLIQLKKYNCVEILIYSYNFEYFWKTIIL